MDAANNPQAVANHTSPADAKVSNIGPSVLVQQHILWLEVPVHHCWVQVGQARSNVQANLQDL